jgi:uncharacterized protein
MYATPDKTTVTPWYREPWPWLLMAGPAIVVVAGFVTLAFAIQSSDGLVADDYYKQGNAINMTLQRDARAQKLGYRANISIAAEGRVALEFVAAAPPVDRLRLILHHPTRAGFDREILLTRASNGTYFAMMPAVNAPRWGLTLEDESLSWRLTGDWSAGAGRVELGGRT